MVGYLILENGQIFCGKRIGVNKDAIFEIVFNTSMSGYMETLTDPSYAKQGVVFTYPLIGNYGVMYQDTESNRAWVSAIIVQELAQFSSNFRKECNLEDFLKQQNVPGLEDVNTRALVKIIREKGAMMAMITGDIKNMAKKIKKLQNAKINNHVSLVTTPKTKIINPKGKYKIALLDFGVKQNIIRSLVQRQCAVTLFPATTNAKFILNKHFHGIVLSNGPGNPKDNTTAISTIKKLYGSDIPILGICLGHQLLSLATGAVTKKLKYGHRGPNHPVKYLENQRVYITSQNHGYYIDEKTINPDIAYVTYRNINDGTVEGLKYRNKKILTVQFHPEACAGPQDTAYIFNDFLKVVKQHYAQRS